MCNRIQARILRGKLCSQRRGSNDGQRVRHNAKNQRQRADGFAIDLCVNRASAHRFACDFCSLPGVDSAHLAESSKPERRQAGEITKTAASGIRDHLERIFEQTCAGSDFEWTAVIYGPSNHNDGGAARLTVAMDVHLGKAVTDELFESFDPVGNYTRTLFQSFIDRVDNCAVGTSAANG